MSTTRMLAHAWKLIAILMPTTLALSSLVSKTEAATAVRTVALSGDSAAGTPVNFASFEGSLLINDFGQVAFEAGLVGANVTATDNRGLWIASGGALTKVLRKGEPAPGVADGAIFADLPADYFLSNVRLNNRGQVAFYALLGGAAVSTHNDTGIWIFDQGQTTLIARRGDALPTVGSEFRRWMDLYNTPNLLLNDQGHVAFGAETRSQLLPVSNTNINQGFTIWSNRTGNLEPVVIHNQVIPGTISGVNLTSNYLSSFNNRDQILFGLDRVWLEEAGSFELLGSVGDPAPGTTSADPGLVFTHLEPANLNEAGQALLYGGVGEDVYGFWVKSPESFDLVYLGLRPAPGLPDGFQLNWWPYEYSLNDQGAVVYTSAAADAQQVIYGIWSYSHRATTLVASTGNQAPGMGGEGVVFGGVRGGEFGGLSLNDRGQVSFFAGIQGPMTPPGTLGVWATDTGGNLQRIVVPGDLLEVRPGDVRQVSWFTSNPSLNENGQIALGLTFTDHSSGIFVFDTVAIPEPTAAILLLPGGIALFVRRRVCRLGN